MTRHILTTKISVPPLIAGVVLRPRLLHRLDSAAAQQLFLVSAPAGSGKTTLVASWINQLRKKAEGGPGIGWLSLGAEDNEPIRFFHHFIFALEQISPGIEQILQPSIGTFQFKDYMKLMVQAINYLTSQDRPGMLVFDDYHLIRCPELHQVLRFFIEHLPPNFKLVIVTREEPSLPLHKWRARGELTEIAYEELRFSADEVAMFFSQTMGLELPSQEVQHLEATTEGWIAGLQMAALTLRGEKHGDNRENVAQHIAGFNSGNRYIVDYFVEEVLQQLAPPLKSFLHQSSILDRFNVSLCNEVMERDDSQTILQQLEKANLFLVPLDEEGQWYRYHPLFADLCRSELGQEERRRLHARASRWFAQAGMTTEAIRQAIGAKDFESAVSLIQSQLDSVLRAGKQTTLLEWMNLLPEEVVLDHIDMTVAKGWLLFLKYEIGAAQVYIDRAMGEIPAGTPQLQQGIIYCFRGCMHLHQGQMREALEFSELAVRLLEDHNSFFLAVAKQQLGFAQGFAGNQNDAIVSMREAFDLSLQMGNDMASLDILATVVAMLNRLGKISEALLLGGEMFNRHLDRNGNPQPILFSIAVSLGESYYEINDLVSAENMLATGISLSDVVGVARPIILGQCTLANLYFATGRFEKMEAALAAAQEAAESSATPAYIRTVEVVTAQIRVRQGQLVEAARILDVIPGGQKRRNSYENIVLAGLLLARGEAAEAKNVLSLQRTDAENRGRTRNLILILLRLAQAHHLLGQPEEAARCLEPAIEQSASSGYQRLFLDEGNLLRSLLAQHRSGNPGFVSAILDAFTREIPGDAAGHYAHAELLSQAQIRIMRLVAEGHSNREIADRLGISEGTAKWHLNQVYARLNVRSRTQAIAEARMRRIL